MGHPFLGSSTAFDLAVWIDATVYDPTNAVDIAPAAYSVAVNLNAMFANEMRVRVSCSSCLPLGLVFQA
jgi:hypothetical protein